MQALLCFLVPLLVAGAPAPAPEIPAAVTATAVLGWSALPPRTLIARCHDETHYSLALLDGRGKVLEETLHTFDDAAAAPPFKAAALREWEAAAEWLARAQLTRARSRTTHPDARAVVIFLPGTGESTWELVTAQATSSLGAIPAEREHSVYPYFPDGQDLALLVGWVATDEGRQGIWQVATLPAKSRKLKEVELAAAWQRSAQAHFDREHYAAAAELLAMARRHQETPTRIFLAALTAAYRQQWPEALKLVAELGQSSGKNKEALVARTRHEPLLREAALRTQDFNGSGKYSFKASKGFEGTSVWVKIKDEQGKSIAIFKPTNGNTYHRGEIFTYQIAKILRLEQMYPVTYLYTLDKEGCAKFVKSLDKVQYKGMKERNRAKLVKVCQRKGHLEGAVKEWVNGFQFFQAIGTRDKVKKHRIFRYLDRKRAQPPADEEMKVRTITRLYKPDHCKRATYKGRLNVAQFARDLSNLLAVDVLNANEDRFPGANVDFKTLGEVTEQPECTFRFGPSRLFSLDNGATFKGTYSNAYVDYSKRLKPTRFDRRTYQRLKAIERFIKGEIPAPRFLANWGIQSVEDLSRFVALDKGDSHKRRKEPFKLFETNLRYVLRRMDAYVDDKDAWFKSDE